jgi:hypothetical protein
MAHEDPNRTSGATRDAAPADAPPGGASATGKPLTEAARRALAEAQARRAELDARRRELEVRVERNGRDGPEPVRYGDWEVKGIATDF